MGTGLLAPGALAGAGVVIEEGTDAAALAGLLRGEGALANVATSAALDAGADPRPAAAFLDVWTPETAPRVEALRRDGVFVTCLADLLLARAGARTIGVTGTAGKTTTTVLVDHLLRSAGIDVAAPVPGVSGNRWPDGGQLPALGRDVPILVELTSSHLAFCHSSPHVAVVTAFWPDHVELHGSFEAYARAKETIARHQVAEDLLIVPGDPSCERFVRASRARVARFSLAGPVSEGAFVRDGGVVVRRNDVERVVADVASLPAQGRFVANLLAACVAAMAAGVPAAALAEGLRSATLPAFRHVEVARAGGVSVYDDSMAGTPAKAAAVLELFPDASVVLVAGGEVDGAGGAVHATAEERALLEEACALARRKARRTILFGAAAAELAELLPGAEQADDLAGAVTRACAVASGAAAVVVAPMFPVAPSDREQVARVARRAAGSTPSSS